MTVTLKVPSIACEACAKTITRAIETQQPGSAVSVDVAGKLVKVETTASESAIKEAIVSVGHTIEL
ncbi:MAG: hypothetical protein N5P05_001247 [Chroococcopsis gigantea SAG 12.99]|jgi:copper chaperone|nr:heavy-metal-associated domain-containing protein [Chlorogloea purpurea SAG 13.99]MDV2999641.1 hypothetical protein [Chroococcopsis gigantea SAG 12.99]